MNDMNVLKLDLKLFQEVFDEFVFEFEELMLELCKVVSYVFENLNDVGISLICEIVDVVGVKLNIFVCMVWLVGFDGYEDFW